MSGRGKGGKSHAFPGDFIALGSKSGSSKVTNSSSSSSHAHAQNISGGMAPAKKGKPIKSSSGGSLVATTEKLGHSWETIAEEVEMVDLVSAVEAAYSNGDTDRPERLLCGAVKNLRSSRAKPDTVTWMSMLHLAKNLPTLFSCSEYVRDALCSLLKRDMRESFKSKGNCLVSVLAANVLYTAYQDVFPWPEQFLKVYIDDAIGERVWVDNPECRQFTDNILTAFNTILPPAIKHGDEGGGLACPSPPTGSSSGSRTPTRPDEEIQVIDLPINREPVEETGCMPRYNRLSEVVEQMTVNIVKDQLNRRTQGQQSELTRNFIRFLTFACGVPEIRLIVAGKLEIWLINPKIARSAQELLRSVCLNCTTGSQIDVEVMVLLIKQRLKNKQTITFLTCLRDLCAAHPENLSTILKHTIFNELSNSRNSNNMAMLGVMFQVNPDKAAGALAGVFLELLLQKDCYLRALRILLREIVRCVRHDISLTVFCNFLMSNQLRERFEVFKEFEYKERMFTSLVDLITQAIFLAITPQVRESFSALTRGDRKDTSNYKTFLVSVSNITRDTIWWLHDVVPKLFKPEPSTYTAMLYKSLFMTQTIEEYFRLDGFPLETDRALFFKLTAEVPVQQETLLRIFLIGMSKTLALNGQDCLTIAETLIKRAAGLHMLASKDFPILSCDKAADFMECVWQLTAYTYPESISLPQDYQPPSMAITASYWKAWQLLLIMTAYNPEEFGTAGWKNYPTLRAMMEMCITNQFVFPPPTASPDQAEDMKSQERQVDNIEKQQILEFESQLAAASSKQLITEQNSLLLSTIISLNPHGPLRRPPQQVLDQLKQINTHYKIGHLLCRSRKPDFLLDILQRQGTNQAMPWLADLVENSEGSFSVLPVQCLCEFLLNDALAVQDVEQEHVQGRVKKRKAGELLQHLQQLLQNPNSDPATCLETLDYFLARLASMNTPSRLQALAGLRLILTPGSNSDRMDVDETEDGDDWLLRYLPALPCFPLVYRNLATSLRQACQVETDPATVSLYIRFLSQMSCNLEDTPQTLEDLRELVFDMAHVIVERTGLIPAILPGTGHIAAISHQAQLETYEALLRLFYVYMLLVRQPDREVSWSNREDLINIIWKADGSATLHIYVVQAQIILLTYGDLQISASSGQFNNLLEMWFPSDGELPSAFLLDTGEPAMLIQDWLKLKMIRTDFPILVDSALRDLVPQQLVLFIQSFGIPVDSMTKLLQTLDAAVSADLEAIKESVLDKAYLGKLVGVQHRRGAQGGLVFAHALQLDLDLGANGPELSEVNNVLSELVIPPRSTAMIPPGHVRTTLLHIFDVGSPVRMNSKERQDTFRTLQKFLAEEISSYNQNSNFSTPMIDATLSAIQNILASPDLSSSFLRSLCQKTPFSVGLMRLLTNGLKNDLFKDSQLLQTLYGICSKLLRLLEEDNKTTTPLMALVKSFVNEVSTKKQEVASSKELDLSGGNVEEELKVMVQEALRKNDTKDVVSKISSLLLEDKDQGLTGLLVDWLELLDPTIISSCPELQMKLVFGITLRKKKNKDEKPSSDGNCRPYLLSLLTHQASYQVLRSTVSSLLSSCHNDFEPSSVLDFLSACIHIPRLWQGRDQRPPKNHRPEDVLQLSNESLVNLVQYVIEEAANSDDNAREAVRSRVDLLQRCLSTDEKIATVIKYLVEQQTSLSSSRDQIPNSIRLETVKTVIMEIYMRIPGCFNSLLDEDDLQLVSSLSLTSSDTSQSILDIYSHTLLSALSLTQMGKHWTVKMQEYELCARKLMSSHPVLFLRNLPLMSSCLRGRTHYEFVLFRSCNHLTLFTIILGLLELARPYIFNAGHKQHLEDALGCYMDMIDSYLYKRDSFIGIIDRIIQFLISWQESGAGAGFFLRKYSGVLTRLSSSPGIHKMESIRTLMSTVSLHAGSVSDSSGVKNEARTERHYVHESLDPETGRLVSELSLAADSSDKLISVLTDIQAYSAPRPNILIHFQDELMYHLSHSSNSVRNLVYNLLLRHLKQRPDQWRHVLPGYLNALQSGDESVINSGLNNLPEFAVLCQENVDLLLKTVFKLNINSNLNTTTHIINAINMLNLQSGNN